MTSDINIYLVVSVVFVILIYFMIYSNEHFTEHLGIRPSAGRGKKVVAPVASVPSTNSIAISDKLASDKLALIGPVFDGNLTGDLTASGKYFKTSSDGIILGNNQDNSWILQSPNDPRNTLFIAPGVKGEKWDWKKQVSVDKNGNVGISGNMNVRGGLDVSSGQQLTIRDKFHGLGYSGDVDGPALYGYGGGKLRVAGNAGGETTTDPLVWNREGVNINGTLTVNGKPIGHSIQTKCRNISTPLNDMGNSYLFLDRHNLQCNDDENLTKNQFIRGGPNNSQIQLVGRCCKSTGSGYKFTENLDYPGNDIVSLSNQTLDQCRANCDANGDCAGFNFSKIKDANGNDNCLIKNKLTNPTATNSWDFYAKN
jgi:hypothetical protein